MSLPENFANPKGDSFPAQNNSFDLSNPEEGFFTAQNNSLDSNETESFCQERVAVVFHAFRNSKLFQSATGEKENLELPSDELLLGKDTSVVNSLVMSATLSEGLDTDHLVNDVELLFEELVSAVSVGGCRN